MYIYALLIRRMQHAGIRTGTNIDKNTSIQLFLKAAASLVHFVRKLTWDKNWFLDDIFIFLEFWFIFTKVVGLLTLVKNDLSQSTFNLRDSVNLIAVWNQSTLDLWDGVNLIKIRLAALHWLFWTCRFVIYF